MSTETENPTCTYCGSTMPNDGTNCPSCPVRDPVLTEAENWVEYHEQQPEGHCTWTASLEGGSTTTLVLERFDGRRVTTELRHQADIYWSAPREALDHLCDQAVAIDAAEAAHGYVDGLVEAFAPEAATLGVTIEHGEGYVSIEHDGDTLATVIYTDEGSTLDAAQLDAAWADALAEARDASEDEGPSADSEV